MPRRLSLDAQLRIVHATVPFGPWIAHYMPGISRRRALLCTGDRSKVSSMQTGSSAASDTGVDSKVAWRVTTDASEIPPWKVPGAHRWYFMYNEADPARELCFTEAEWSAFLAGIRGGEFDIG